MFGHSLKASDGFYCTSTVKAPGLHCGAASVHFYAEVPILERDKLFGIQERRVGASSFSPPGLH